MKRLFILCIATLCFNFCDAQIIHSAYDVNGDGKTDIADLAALVNRLLGKTNDDAIHSSTIKIDTIHYQHIVNDTIQISDTIRNIVYVTDTIKTKGAYTINGIEYPMPEFIDLGLSSGTLWANMDLGASIPDSYGLQFAWGETNPKDPKIMTEENYKYFDGYYEGYNYWLFAQSKYSSINDTYGCHDGKYMLDAEDNAAKVYLGDEYDMPTKEQLSELLECCDVTTVETSYHHFYCIFTSKVNKNQIKVDSYVMSKEIPCDGCNAFNNIIHSCFYYCLTPIIDDANYIDIDYIDRYYGGRIRPIINRKQ